MTRKSRSLLITLILLVAIGGSLILVRTSRKPPETPGEAVERKTETLSSVSTDDLRSVLVRRDGEVLEFYSADGEIWMVGDTPEYYRPAADRVNAAVRALSGMKSSNIITDDVRVSELSDFGLVKPGATVVLTDREGKTTTVEIGRESPSGAGRYARKAGSSVVVLLPDSTADRAFDTVSDYRDTGMPVINLETMSMLEYRHGGRIVRIEPRTDNDPFVALASAYSLTSPWRGRYPLDDYEFNKILTEDSPLPVKVKEYRDDLDPGDPALGLDGDFSDLLLVGDSEGSTLSLIIGEEDGRGNRYVRYGDRADAVFLLDDSDLELVKTEPFRLLSKFVFLGSIFQVSQVKVEQGRKTWIMNRTGRGDPEDIKDDRFDVNSLEIPQASFTEVYQRFIGIMLEGEIDEAVNPGNPEVRITVSSVQPGTDPRIIRFWPYNDVYFQVSIDDGPLEFLVGRYQVNEFLADLAAVAELAS